MTEGERSTAEGYAKKISERMFGRQSAYTLERDPVVIRPVGMIVEDLCRLEDLEWARYAFSREPLNGKFDDESRISLTQKALLCGKQAASELIERYGTSYPLKLAKELGLYVNYPAIPQGGGRVLFAEFRPPNEINIFTDGVDKATKLMEDPDVKDALGEISIRDILLAHELFHCVEEKQAGDIWTKTYKIDLWGIGPLRYRSGVVTLSEIAAMGFCKQLCELPYSPYVMDAFLVYGYSSDNASRLYEEMMGYAGKEARLPE